MKSNPATLLAGALAAAFVISTSWTCIQSGESETDPLEKVVPTSSHTEPKMVAIPGGRFEMGSSAEEIEAAMERYGIDRKELFTVEIPRHTVELDAFELDRYSVTNRQFQIFLLENPSWEPDSIAGSLHNGDYLAYWSGSQFSAELSDVPVVNVSWYAAEAYCRWRQSHLPTEAQWEWAARGGLEDPEFPWGDEGPTDDLANWGLDEIDHPVRVGSYLPNGYGLYDMAGNIWHFCLDEWQEDAYRTAELRNPVAGFDSLAFDLMEVRSRRVIRGGSWGAAAVNMRVTYRDSHPAEEAGDHVGFRCARSG